MTLMDDWHWRFTFGSHAVGWLEGMMQVSVVAPLWRHVLDVLSVMGRQMLDVFALRAYSGQICGIGDFGPLP